MMRKSNLSSLQQKRKHLLTQLKSIKPTLLRGSLIERYKRCGKLNCHCAKTKGHGPAYYLSVSITGQRPVMIYVPLELKQKVEQALENYGCAQQIMEEISSINRELLRQKTSF